MERFCELIGCQTFSKVKDAMEIFSSSSSDEKRAMANCMIRQGSSNQSSPMHIIARDGSFESLVEVVKWVDDIDVRDVPFGSTPLMAAMVKDQYTKVKFLIEKGADVNVVNTMGDSPSHIAVMNAFNSSFRVMLKNATPNLDAKTMYLGRMTSVHDMIIACPTDRDLHRFAIKYLIRTDRITEELFGQYLLPFLSTRDYHGIKDIFDIESENRSSTAKTSTQRLLSLLSFKGDVDDASTITKTSALLVTHCIRLDMCKSYIIEDLVVRGHLDAVRLHIVSSPQPVTIVASPIVYEVVVSLYSGGSSISRQQLREMIDREIRHGHNEYILHSLHKLSRFANALLTSELDESLPTLHNIAFATMTSIDEKNRLTSLRQHLVQARLTRNWKLLLQK